MFNTNTVVSFSVAHPSTDASVLAATAALQTKGRVLEASMANLSRVRQHLDEPSRAVLDQLTQLAAQRARLIYATPEGLSEDALDQQVTELGEKQAQIEDWLSTHDADFQQLLQPVTLERVQHVMDPSDVLIEWTHFVPIDPIMPGGHPFSSPRYAAYIITRDHAPVTVDLGDAESIDTKVVALRDVLRGPDNNAYPLEAHAAYNAIMKPVWDRVIQLSAHPARLLMSPDAGLNLIPFAALIDDQERYLGRNIEINYLTSGRDLLRFDSARSDLSRDGVTVVAAANYDATPSAPADSRLSSRQNIPTIRFSAEQSMRSVHVDRRHMQFGPLQGTEGEAKLLTELFKLDAEHVVVGNDASVTRIMQMHGLRKMQSEGARGYRAGSFR